MMREDIMRELVRGIVESRKMEKILAMSSLAKKCKKCFHYRFQDPDEVMWYHTFVPVGHICDYSENPNIRILFNPVKQATIDNRKYKISKYYEFEIQTIKERVESGECEFKEFPEPRSQIWGDEDPEWDSKYKAKYLQLLGSELREAGVEESEIQEIVREL